MRNCIVLGCGRSGTSLAAGLLAKAGYFMGNSFHPARVSNPKGFFEGPEINGINEELLSQVVKRSQGLHRGQRWLATIKPGTSFPSSPAVEACITWMTSKEPYCFKDPRFSYTLPVWRPHLRNAVFLCVFRNPAITSTSIAAECRNAAYLKNVYINEDYALQLWKTMYSHILDIHQNEGDWLFLHYNQLIDGSAFSIMENMLETTVDRTFPDHKLNRSQQLNSAPPNVHALYARLCDLAGYHINTD